MKHITTSLFLLLFWKISFAQVLKSSNSINAEIIHTIPSPTTSTNDIAFDGKNLWQASNDGLLYQLSPLDGKVIKTLPVNTLYASGIAFDGKALWVSDRINKLLFQIDTSNGSILREIGLESQGPAGLAWDDNGALWHNNNEHETEIGDATLKYYIAGDKAMETYHILGDAPGGLTLAGDLLLSTDRTLDKVYAMNKNDLRLIYSFDAPGGEYPNGLAYDGEYIWVANNETDSLYKVKVTYRKQITASVSSKITVRPNPSRDKFEFTWGNGTTKQNITIQVHNALGQLILEKDFSKDQYALIHLGDVEKGVYFYTILNLSGIPTNTGKLLKQ